MHRQRRVFSVVFYSSLAVVIVLVLARPGAVSARHVVSRAIATFEGVETAARASSLQAEIDPVALAAMGASPEDIQQLELAIAQAKATPVGYGGSPVTTRGAPSSVTPVPAGPGQKETVYSPEFCEILERWNAEKRIADAEIRTVVEGQYGHADDVKRHRTWKVDTACGDFLVAAPMWADVSPSVLSHKGGNLFEDSQGGTWDFQKGSDGAVVGVTLSFADGSVSELKHWGDPHIDHKKDKEKWDFKQ